MAKIKGLQNQGQGISTSKSLRRGETFDLHFGKSAKNIKKSRMSASYPIELELVK